MNEDYRNWIVVIDDWKARLYEPRLVPGDRRRLELRAAVEEERIEKEHGRPQALGVKNGHYDYAAPPHEDEERRRRFGRRVAEWIDERIRAERLRHVDVLASPRTLGEVRRACEAKSLKRVEFHRGDIGFLDEGAMVRHPMVTALLDRPPASVGAA